MLVHQRVHDLGHSWINTKLPNYLFCGFHAIWHAVTDDFTVCFTFEIFAKAETPLVAKPENCRTTQKFPPLMWRQHSINSMTTQRKENFLWLRLVAGKVAPLKYWAGWQFHPFQPVPNILAYCKSSAYRNFQGRYQAVSMNRVPILKCQHWGPAKPNEPMAVVMFWFSMV